MRPVLGRRVQNLDSGRQHRYAWPTASSRRVNRERRGVMRRRQRLDERLDDRGNLVWGVVVERVGRTWDLDQAPAWQQTRPPRRPSAWGPSSRAPPARPASQPSPTGASLRSGRSASRGSSRPAVVSPYRAGRAVRSGPGQAVRAARSAASERQSSRGSGTRVDGRTQKHQAGHAIGVPCCQVGRDLAAERVRDQHGAL